MVKNKREARRIGKLAKGKPKTFSDPAAATEQRRLAGIASGKARRQRFAKLRDDIEAMKQRVYATQICSD